MNGVRKIIIVVLIVLALVTMWIAFCGYQWSWGPFNKLHDIKTSHLEGNSEMFDLNHQEKITNSPIENKQIVFLGSSVTYGAASHGVSFADYLQTIYGCKSIKEAVSGTTLVDNGPNSYVSRLKRMKVDGKVELFVCQLSTNDASQNKPLGELSNSFSINDFDTKTTIGAIEYIIAYAKDVFKCPIVFYTSPKYDSERYNELDKALHLIAQKWNVKIIDMWCDDEFNNISDADRNLFLADKVHPTQAGYLKWWTPYFAKTIIELIGEENG